MIVLGIGSSIEPKEYYLKKSLEEFEKAKDIEIIKVSKVYLTKAWGGVAENEFLNICVLINFLGSAEELLDITQNIENKLGRIREKHWDDRTIDIDILLFNNEKINNDRLIVPHKYITKRNFVLYPLLDVCGDIEVEDKKITKWIEEDNNFIKIYKEIL